MRYLALALLLALTPAAFGEEPEFEVMVDTNNYSPKEFAGKGVKASAMPQKPARGAIPEKPKRDADFASVKGLDLSKLDELDRDRLYVLARTVDFTQLRKSFPEIPEKPLRALHRKLQR
jgi:hypothetical protein